MERIIATVQVAGTRMSADLDLPADLPADQIIPLMTAALGIDLGGRACALFSVPERHRLRPNESLAAAQIWDGSRLVLLIDQRGAPPPVPAPPITATPAPKPAEPSITWNTLAPAHPPQPDPASTVPDDGFSWKPVR
jgi:uncharacterized ubiquitin-like protein YukD